MKSRQFYIVNTAAFACIILALFCIHATGCYSDSNARQVIDTEASFEIPELLIRNDVLSNAVEWEARVGKVNKFSAALIENPTDAGALIGLAMEFGKEARVTGEHGYYYPTVLSLCDRALAITPLSDDDRFMALLVKAHGLLSQHHFKAAEKVALEAYRINPYNADIYTALIDANVELGNYETAAKFAQELVDVKPGLVAYARASYIREIFGDTEGAIWAMEQAVKAGVPGYENTEWARVTLAELHMEMGNLSKAEELYQISLATRPEYPFAKAGLAEVYLERDDYTAAIALLKEALHAAPEVGFQQLLVKSYRAAGQLQLAREAYDEVLVMYQDDIAHGHHMDLDLANTYLDLADDLEEALPLAKKCYEARPDNIEVNALMARLCLRMGDRSKARMHYDKAVRMGTKSQELRQIAEALGV